VIYFPDGQNVRLQTDGISRQTGIGKKLSALSHFVIPRVARNVSEKFGAVSRARDPSLSDLLVMAKRPSSEPSLRDSLRAAYFRKRNTAAYPSSPGNVRFPGNRRAPLLPQRYLAEALAPNLAQSNKNPGTTEITLSHPQQLISLSLSLSLFPSSRDARSYLTSCTPG